MKKIKKNSGAAMIAVLCIMAIFVTLCLAMLLTSSVLLNRAYKTGYQEQCRVSAVTMSKELEQELRDEDPAADSFYSSVTTQIQYYLNGTDKSWPYLNTNELGHGVKSGVYKTYTMENPNDETGTINLELYWEYENGGDVGSIVLHVDVTAEKDGEQHTIKTVYDLGVAKDQDGVDIWHWIFSERK